MKIAVDFDGVIHNDRAVPKGKRMGLPHTGALETILKWQEEGNEVFVLTSRATGEKQTQAVYDWLEFFNFPPLRVTNIKETADMYLDDRAVKFTSWNQWRKTL